jgi:hypothetical protein
MEYPKTGTDLPSGYTLNDNKEDNYGRRLKEKKKAKGNRCAEQGSGNGIAGHFPVHEPAL